MMSALLVVLLFVGFVPGIFGSVPRTAAATISGDCSNPAVMTGTLPTAPSSFTLTVIGSTGTTVTITQNTIFNYAACWSWGGFVSSGQSHDYGNYTGIPLLTLVNLVGGVSPGGIVVTQGEPMNNPYNCTYTYDEVTTGTGWTTESTSLESSSCVGPFTPEYSIAGGGTPVALASPVPMYLVLAYMENASDSATSGSPGVGALAGTRGPLRTVTVAGGSSATSGYLLSAGASWNEGVFLIQVFNPVSIPTPEFPQSAIAAVASLAALSLFGVYTTRKRISRSAPNLPTV